MFVLVGLLVSVNNIYAKTVPSNQVNAIVKILKTLGIESGKISEIKKILEDDNITTPVKNYSPNTGKEIIPEPKIEATGCENNYKFNIKTGQPCSSYKAPTPQKCSGWCPASA